ncbi:MAG: hypothetical protein JJE13_08680 [Thermoleophilia bacterium]|nr:hypothetical protein [Thermoleophilia bacterium]
MTFLLLAGSVALGGQSARSATANQAGGADRGSSGDAVSGAGSGSAERRFRVGQKAKKKKRRAKPCRSTKKGPVYRTPGYRGACKAPKTGLAPPLPSFTLSTAGRFPDLIVDAAGTAHVVWTEDGGTGPDRLRYCRIRRAATTCDNPSSTQSVFPVQPGGGGNDPQFNDDSSGPAVVAIGDDLGLITRRYPNVVPTPIGGSSSSSTYLWVSDNGGQTLTGPGLVGDAEPSGGATVFGPVDSPRVGLISDTKTGGTYFQSISSGSYSANPANLGAAGPDRAYSGSLATVDERPLTAFADLSNQIFIRQWNGSGSPNSPANWTETQTTGIEPRLAAGPIGSFLVDRAGFGKPLRLSRLNGTSRGQPVTVSDTSDSGSRDLFADPGGALRLAWVDGSSNPSRLLERNTRNGTKLSSPRILAESSSAISQVEIAAAADGGGFATYVSGGDGQAYGEVEVTPSGVQEATNAVGLGSRPGSGAAPGTEVKCQEIDYGAVQILATQGCLLSAAGQSAAKVSEGPLRLNGLEIIPDADAKILLGTRERTIDTTGKVTVRLRAPGGPIDLFHGELHVRLPSGAEGVRLFSFDTKNFPVDLEGFPVQGDIDVILKEKSVEIPIALSLPKVFGGLTGNLTLRASNAGGLEVSSMRFRVGNLVLGPVVLSDLDINWDGGANWTGSGTILIAGAVISADLQFTDGAFSRGAVEITPVPFPGVPLFTDVFLNKISGELELDPFAIEAGGVVGARPIAPPDTYTFGIDSKLRISTKPVFAVDVTGVGSLAGFPISNSHLHGDADGYFSVHSKSRIDLEGIISAGTEINGFFDANNGQFGASAGFSGCLGEPPFGICSGFEGLVSSTGIAACAGGFIGFGYRWGEDAELLGPPTCDTGPFEVRAVTAARSGRAAGQGLDLPAGLPSAGIRVTGDGGPPDVVVISPSGTRFTPVPVSAEAAKTEPVTVATSGDETHIGLLKPAGGSWQVEANPGPTITEVAVSKGLSPPKVSGNIKTVKRRKGRSSRSRVLTYRATSRKGLVVRYFEQIGTGGHLIGTSKKKSGRITFSAGDGPAGKRAIVAEVDQDGLPRLKKTIAHYRAPGPIKPPRVRGLKLRRKGGKIQARWQRSEGADTYTVRVRLSDGRNLLKLVESPRIRLGGIGKKDKVRVTVTGRSAAGRTGRPASASFPHRKRR